MLWSCVLKRPQQTNKEVFIMNHAADRVEQANNELVRAQMD